MPLLRRDALTALHLRPDAALQLHSLKRYTGKECEVANKQDHVSARGQYRKKASDDRLCSTLGDSHFPGRSLLVHMSEAQ